MFTAYSGKQMSCNPKYIYEYINATDCNLETVWAFDSPENYLLGEKTIKVRYKNIKYLYYVLTSKIIVENFESWSVLPIRKNQIVINTWHGGGAYKKVGIDRKDARSFNEKIVSYKNKRVGLFLSSSEVFSEMTIRNSFKYDGEILASGMPRNDIFFNDNFEKKDNIKKKLEISNEKIIIVAPTFRTKSQSDMSNLDFDKLTLSLKEKFGGEWIVLYRSHYYDNIKTHSINTNVIDVSNYPDMQELLLISDVLLTDYSSSMWDFSLKMKPVFLFSTDLESYIENERDFYTPMNTWPFKYSSTFDELLRNIKNYDEELYIYNVNEHHKKLGSFENGTATEQVANYIFDIMGGGKRNE